MRFSNDKTRLAGMKSCILAAGLAAAGAGCATPSRFDFVTGSVSPPPGDTDCILAAGDDLDVKFYYAPELNESEAIRPDGRISLQLVGDVQASGLTPSALEKSLEDKYHGLIDKNEITVIARRLSHRVVYVGGAVQRPQEVPMPGNMTALAAIMGAGGEDPQTAAMGEVIVLREESGKYHGYALDLAGTLLGTNMEAFYLRPGDIVYVSRTRISDVDRWIAQHVNRLVPQFGFTVLHTSGNTTVGYDMSH